MFKKKPLICLFFLFFLIYDKILSENDSISLTYIANCGFLIEMDNQKIIIDGLFRFGHNRYPTPDTITQKHLVSNNYPFNNINLILVSHTHVDHFDSEMVINCMLNNPAALLVCPQQVIELISENETVYNKIKTRIIGSTPDAYTSELIHISGMEIYVCRLPHVGEKYKNMQHIAFLISVNGKSVFHSGDTDPHQIYNYTGIKISDMKVDIGLINEDFGKIENAAYTREFIMSKYNVAMHFPDSVAIGWLDSLKGKPDLFPNPYIFTKKMDKKVFYNYHEE